MSPRPFDPKRHRSRAKRSSTTIACGKRRFRDKNEALNAMRKILGTSNRSSKPARVYACPHCKGYHLTSQA